MPLYRVFKRKELDPTTMDTFYDIINCRVWLPAGITEANIKQSTEVDIIHGGFVLEFKCLMPEGVLNVSDYYDSH